MTTRAGRALAWMARGCTIAGGLALIAMMLVTDWDILARQVAGRPLDGVVEMVEIAVLAVAMLGLPEAFLRDENIRVDLLDPVVGPHGVRLLRLLATVLSLAFLLLVAWNIVPPMLDVRRFGDMKPDLGVAVWPLYALILFAVCAAALSCVQGLVALLRPVR